MTQSKFRPLGSRNLAQTSISRRAFLGTGMAVPAVLALDNSVWAAAPLGPPYDLRFVEDAQGMSVINAHDQVWRLHRLAFGPSTTFTLRTLQAGNREGYELQIGNLRFGSLEGRNHWIVFQRIGDEDDGWKVRMRSNLWSEPQGEITSEDVSFRDLLEPPSSPGAEWFHFPRASFTALRALERAVEGHVQASGGIGFTLGADCSWRFAPVSGGRLMVVPYGFQLESLTLAWCEPVPPAQPKAGSVKPAPQKDAAKTSAEQKDTALPQGLLALAAIDQDTEISLLRHPSKEESDGPTAQPIFCAAGDIKAGNQRLLFRGDASFSLSLKHQSYIDKPSLTYNYLRGNWNSGVRMPAGIAELAIKSITTSNGTKEPAGRWSVTTFAGRQATLGEVAVDDAFLRVRRRAGGGFEDEFVGFAAPLALDAKTGSGNLAQSPIGALQIGNCPVQERTSRQNRTVFQSHHTAGSPACGRPGALQNCSVPLRLFACPLSLPGTDYSQFTFDAAALHAVWCPAGKAAARALEGLQSYLWIGSLSAIENRPVMKLDLSRARLAGTRSEDLLEVAFLFADLWLEIRKGKTQIVPSAPSYRVLRREVPSSSAIPGNTIDERDDILDTRPVLVVEFPPQHVFEEAIFKTATSDLPEVTLLEGNQPAPNFTVPGIGSVSTNPVTLAERLSGCRREDRKTIRAELARQKIKQGDSKLFKELHERLLDIKGEDPNWEKIDDQFIYIGPYCMDPDVRARARCELAQIVRREYDSVWDEFVRGLAKLTDGFVNPNGYSAQLLRQADKLADGLNNPDSYPESDQSFIAKRVRALRMWWRNTTDTAFDPPSGPADAILHEQAIAALLPGYDLFRDYYREEMIARWTDVDVVKNKPASGGPEEIEFFSAKNRRWASQTTSMEARQTEMAARYDEALTVEPDIAAVMRARLANPSRLAFHLNTEPGKAIGFDLNSLLDWHTHELAVSPRARAITPYDQEGRPSLPEDLALQKDSLDADFRELSERHEDEASKAGVKQDPGNGAHKDSLANKKQEQPALSGAVEDVSMLRSLGFHFGTTVTAEQRLTDVEASLRSPGLLETAIEMPARLILSPSQTAQWRVPWTPVVSGPYPKPLLCPRPLWSVELVTAPVDPAVRAIYSPDLRPGFVRQNLERAAAQAAKPKNGVTLTVPTSWPPPRGPRAPWTLGIEDGGPKPSSSDEVAKQLGLTILPAGKAKTPQDKSGTPESDETLPPLLRYLRRRENDNKNYKRSAIFRSSLDAYDRHEIVILSSAYGLPVSGKRDVMGKLLPLNISSQAEPPEVLQPIDLTPGNALYRPRSLKIREMRLSALGGTLRHDTDFVPPTAAEHLVYGPLHDSLSVERWQHWIVLGRDVFAEVVYKGFLFPIGHRASLVKQTERVFLRANSKKDLEPSCVAPDGSVRAYLLQRIFIRIGEPHKAFPALGQPNQGRQFPPRSVLLLTTVTPDLVDPSQNDPGQDDGEQSGAKVIPNSAGRLLAGYPGLVFWPRTARAAGSEVRFEALVDASFVKLPLIFVDNAAAQNADTIKALTTYYNGILTPVSTSEIRPLEHLRTLDFKQQSLRYCEEVKPSSATHRTVYWNLKASGGADSVAQANVAQSNGEGENTVFHNSVLDGADQPSFYPAIELACIRLDQVERMTANKANAALVAYDGHYLQFGFPFASRDRQPDQSTTQTGNSTAPDPKAVPNVSDDQRSRESAQQKEAEKNHLEIYLNVTNEVSFNMGAAGDRSGGVFRPAADVVALSRVRGPLGGSLTDRVSGTFVPKYQTSDSSYRNHFTTKPGSGPDILDTRLLGILSLKDVVNFCKLLRPAAEGLPQLQEVLTYGASAAGATEQTLQTKIIQPLARAIAELNHQWDRVDQQLRDAQRDNKVLAVGLSDIFPELSRARNDFAAALGTTQSLNGVEFFASLGDVYETGVRLEGALEQASTHTPERSFLAIVNALPTFVTKYFNLGDVSALVIKPLFTEIGDKEMGAKGSLDIHNFTAFLAVLAVKGPLVQRFFPAAGGLKQAALDTLAHKQQELDTYLQLVSNSAASVVAQQFAAALREEPELASLAERWASTTLPLFEMASAIYQAVAGSDDPQKWATAALAVVSQLWPIPDDLRCTERKLLTGVQNVLNGTILLTDGLSDAAKSEQSFKPSSDYIALPPFCDPNTKAVKAKNGEIDLCSFARAAHDVLVSVNNGEGRAFLIKAANAVLLVEQQLLLLADLLPAMGQGSRLQNTVDVRPEFLTSFFDELQHLVDLVMSAFNLLLPDPLPPLEAPDAQLQHLADTLNTGVSSLIRCQRYALDLTTAWVTTWVPSGEKAMQADLTQQITVNRKLLDKALDTAGRCNSWSAWTKVNRDVIRPLPADLLTKLIQQGAQYLQRAWSQVLSLPDDVEQRVLDVSTLIFKSVAGFYQTLWDGRGKLIKEVLPDDSVVLVAAQQARTWGADVKEGDPTENTDQLFYDKEAMAKLQAKSSLPATDPACYQFLVQFLRDWASGNDTPHLIFRKIQQNVSLESARARLLSIVDFSRLREEIDQAIRQLIPHSSELTYAFNIALEPDAVQKASLGFCLPNPGCNLTIISKTKIDFESGKTQFRSEGELGAFDIKLLGAIADAVTLRFDGVHFQSTGGPASCDVHFHSVVIGPMFKFLEQLQKFLSPKKGSGFYLVPLAEGVGIEAGYGLNLGTISFGNISFANVSLNAAARLPFDAHEATFTASLSRRDAPFTISVAPYGGAGFFLIEASAQGVTAFEASFEYGGAAAFSYGPLSGYGRVMVGIYIRVGRQGKIAATFFAGGTASVWIFSFSASLYITAESESGQSAIVGTATFTFSFSIGFIDYDFHISARQSVEWGSKNDQHASLSEPARPAGFAPADSTQVAALHADTWCQSEHWGRHLEHFDLTLARDVEELV